MLTQQDQTDLIGLVSGLGSPESDGRARELAARDTEAARFVEQVRRLTTCLAPPAESDGESLDSAAIERISTASYTRWRRRRFRKVISSLAVAACLVLFGFGSLRLYRDSVARQTMVMRYELGMNAGGNYRFWEDPKFSLGKPVSTDADHLLLRLGKNRVVMGNRSTAVFAKAGVELKSGQVMIEAKGKFAFQAGPAKGELDTGKAVISLGPDRLYVTILEGSALASTSAGPVTIQSHQQAVWEIRENGRSPVIIESRTSLPYWAAQGLERDDLRPR